VYFLELGLTLHIRQPRYLEPSLNNGISLEIPLLDSTRKVLVFRRFIRVSRDFPRRSLRSATLTSLRVEEEERRVV